MVKPLWIPIPVILPTIGPCAADASRRCGERVGVKPAGGVPLVQQDAQALADDNFAARPAGGQFAADPRNAGFGRQHIDAGQLPSSSGWSRA